jgi:EAL and modified HD-GYP domain-containing signal transduction protein
LIALSAIALSARRRLIGRRFIDSHLVAVGVREESAGAGRPLKPGRPGPITYCELMRSTSNGSRPPGVAGNAHSGAALGDTSVFVARQPIVDRQRRVLGYELLFRPLADASSAGDIGESASAQVISAALLSFDLPRLTHGRRAFINITRDLLISGIPEVLPPGQVVLELLEHIEADDEVVRACEQLRRAGFAIALDDFVLTERTAALVSLADYVKIDWSARASVADINAVAGRQRPRFIAEKIENAADCADAMGLGFDYLQGFFLGRPATSIAREIPGARLNCLRLMQALHQPSVSLREVEDLVKQDAALCYRILRAVNTAAAGQRTHIDSIRQALLLLGRDVVRRWASLWLLAGVGDSAHEELVVMSTIRARCCERLSARLGEEVAAECFLTGLCSLLDAMLDCPMPALLEQLPLSDPVRAALAGEDNLLRRVLECATAYERGDWPRCHQLARQAGVPLEGLPAAQREALQWSALLSDTRQR